MSSTFFFSLQESKKRDWQHVYTDEGKGNSKKEGYAGENIHQWNPNSELVVWALTFSLTPDAEEVTCSEEVEEESHFLNEDTFRTEPSIMCCFRNLWLNSSCIPVAPITAKQVSLRANTNVLWTWTNKKTSCPWTQWDTGWSAYNICPKNGGKTHWEALLRAYFPWRS